MGGIADFEPKGSYETKSLMYLESSRYSFLVAECEGKVVGFIAMRDVSHVFHLFVANEHQKKGIARKLWRHARDQAVRASGAAAFTVNSSLNAVCVYERFGFMPVGAEVQAHDIAYIPMRLNTGVRQ